MRALPRPVLIAAAAATIALGGCGSGAHAPPARDAKRPALIGGAPLQRARCSQWRAGTQAQQRAIVDALAASVGGPSGTGVRGTTLARGDAVVMLDRACASRVARNFLLYELYIRAAAFKSLRAPAQ